MERGLRRSLSILDCKINEEGKDMIDNLLISERPIEKHKLVKTKVNITNKFIVSPIMTEKELMDKITDELASCLVDGIIEDAKVGEISKTQKFESDSTDFEMSLVVINPRDYEALKDAIIGRASHDELLKLL